VDQRGDGTHSEYAPELARKDQERLQLRELLMAGARSESGAPADAGYFESLRSKARKAAKVAARS
jgi:antitoxin ParD1/3/4